MKEKEIFPSENGRVNFRSSIKYMCKKCNYIIVNRICLLKMFLDENIIFLNSTKFCTIVEKYVVIYYFFNYNFSKLYYSTINKITITIKLRDTICNI